MPGFEHDIPLAAIQEHFWTADPAAAAAGSQTECVAVRVHGPLDRTALAGAVAAVVARHEVLRSTVDAVGEPSLRTHPADPTPCRLSWLDLAADTDSDTAAAAAVRTFVEAGTDPRTGPLLHFLAVRTAEDEHVLACAVHHLIADASAVRVVLAELSDDYLALRAGLPSPVPAPALQYGDYVAWEQQSLLPVAERVDAAYWRDALAGAPQRLDLRPDRPRPPVKGTAGQRVEHRFADATRDAVQDFCRQHRVTPYTVALAAFAALVARSTGSTDMLVGVLAANRPQQVEGMVGQFSNTLPLRLRVAGDEGFGGLVERCAGTVAGALEHARLPFSRIVRLARTAHDPSRTALVQHLFLPALQPLAGFRFADLPTDPCPVERGRGRFDTITEVEFSAASARAWVEYDTALYTAAGIDALLRDYEAVLVAGVTEPSMAVSELPLAFAPPARLPAGLAGGIGLRSGDTVLVDDRVAGAAELRAACQRVGARVVEPAAWATVAAVPADRFGAAVADRSVRTVVVDAAVPPAELALLRRDPQRRALRLLQLDGGGLLTLDITGVPNDWPVVTGSTGQPPALAGDSGAVSPLSPCPLEATAGGAGLMARRAPTGELELAGGVRILDVVAAGAPARVAPPSLDPLLGVVSELWSEALDRTGTGPDDDFFVVGGHSIVAARLTGELTESLGVAVKLRTLFEHPTPRQLTAELRRQHPNLEALLQLVEQGAPAGDDPTDDPLDGTVAVEPAEQQRLLPLLAAQRQLWLAEQANPGALTHTIPLLLHIDGQVDVQHLGAAVADVVARQAGLRSTFVESGGEPMQRITPFEGFDVPVSDLRGLPSTERADAVLRLRQETAYGRFDLTRGPLLRARLVRLEDERQVLHLLFHHLVTDELSMTVFMRELSEFYRARRDRRPAALPALTWTFDDAVRAEQALLAGPEGDRLRRFWQRMLAGAQRLEVPTERPREGARPFVGEFLERPGAPELARRVEELARATRTTPFAVFCTAVIALLHRLSGQDDVVIGVPTENRGHRGAEALVGCFLNVLPLRVDCSGDPCFIDLLDRVRDALLQSYEHQRLPFAEIVDTVRPERVPGVHPIYQVTCELQLADWMPLDLPGSSVSYEFVSHGTTRYDLAFHTLLRADGMSVMLELNTDLWDRGTGLTRIDDVLDILQRATTDPGRTLARLGT